MKKKFLFLISLIGVSLVSCSSPQDSMTLVQKAMQEMSNGKKGLFTIEENNEIKSYKFVECSYIDLTTKQTYSKNLSNQFYQVYQGDTVEENVNVSFSPYVTFSSLFDLNTFSLGFNEQDNGKYRLSMGFDLYENDYFNRKIESLYLYVEDETIVYDYTFKDETSAKISLKYEDVVIYPYGYDENTFKNFYEEHQISGDEYMDKLNKKESFNAIFINGDCPACETRERYFYQMVDEDKNLDFSVVNIDDFQNDIKLGFARRLKEAYDKQDAKYKNPSYEIYPGGRILVPTSMKIIDGEIVNVFITLNQTTAITFYELFAK